MQPKNEQTKKLTIRERKKAQPNAVLFFSEAERQTIIDTVAKNLDNPQVRIFFYTCQALGLNPLLNEIAAVTYKDRMTGKSTLSIQVMRDGFLTIAHRSGKFAGLESGVKVDENGKIIFGWAKVYHKDFGQPVYQEADFEEYNVPEKGGKPTLWKSKPKTMIKKVAESMALRKAFNINGVYSPEEMEKEIVPVQEIKQLEVRNGSEPATIDQLKTLKKMGHKFEQGKELTKQEAAEAIKELALGGENDNG